MKRKSWLRWFALTSALVVATLLLAQNYLVPTRAVRSKSSAYPLSQEMTREQQLAQDLALADSRVQGYTVGRRSEVIIVFQANDHYPQEDVACATGECWQVEIYNWDDRATISVLVDVVSRSVVEVFYLPGFNPGTISQQISERAWEIVMREASAVNEVLGYEVTTEDLAAPPMVSDAPGTTCEGEHYCLAYVFNQGDRALWVFVDLTEETMAGLRWTTIIPDEPGQSVTFIPEGGCPPSGSVNRDGWSLQHEVTGSDGLRVYNVTFGRLEVATSIKNVEWHADYGSSGFRDATGCTGQGGFPIDPYGNTQILDLLDAGQNVIGFEVVQDFRMNNWGNSCNYRYEQRMQFYNDGRFRTVVGAYGKGCGTNAMYRPLTRVDIAVEGDGNDSFSYWDGAQWADQSTELWRTPYAGSDGPHQFTPEGYAWRVFDTQSGAGYYLEPGQGQFNDAGRGDDPFIYTVLHKPSEGDADMTSSLGACCNDDYHQGPDTFVTGENIADTNIVLWYVPQSLTDAADGGDGYYCWTLQGEPNPVTFPCFAGPMFVPIGGVPATASFQHNSPVNLGQTAVFTNTSTGSGPLTYTWDFGDNSGTSNVVDPTHNYAAAGTYTVTLTAENASSSDTAAALFEVLSGQFDITYYFPFWAYWPE